MAVIGNAPFQGLVSGGNIIDASIEGVDLSTSAIAARLGYTPVDPGAATFSANPTISSGTANGVGYLNGSKTLTTGSALTFDGTTFGTNNALVRNGIFTIGTDTVYDAFINTPESMYFNVDSDANSTGNKFTWGTDRTGNTGGTTWMTLASSGNLGIGNATPALKLDVAGSIKMSGGTGTALTWDTAIGSQYLMYDSTFNGLILSGYSGLGFRVSGATTDAMRLDSTGLGIGTTSPAKKLDVYLGTTGTVGQYLRNTTINLLSQIDGTTAAQFGTETSHPLVFLTGNTERARIDSSGNLGIAQTDPTNNGVSGYNNLVIGNSSSTVAGITLRTINSGTPTAGIIWARGTGGVNGFVKYDQSVDALTFGAAGTEKARIDSSGRLLLGVTSGTGMSVGDFAMANGKSIRFRNAADSAYISAFEFNTSNGLDIGKNGSLSTITFGISGIGEVSRFDTGGNLGIGTTDTTYYRLNVKGTVDTTFTNMPANMTLVNNGTIAAGLGTGINFSMNYNNSITTTYAQISAIREDGSVGGLPGALIFGTRNSTDGVNIERMRITSTGRMGIGVTSPTWMLEVQGNQESLASFRPSTSTSAGYARFINGGGSFYIGIDSSTGGRISASGLAYAASMTTEGNTALTFGTNNTNRMTIGSTGNIGIGTTATYNSAKVSVAGELEARGSIKSYQSSRGGLASGASVVLLYVPNGYYGAEVSMTIYVSQREDGAGNLSNATYNITAFGSGGVAVTPQGSATYGAGKSFSLTTASGSGGFTVTLNNTAGGTASTGLFMAANVLVGYGAITWGW